MSSKQSLNIFLPVLPVVLLSLSLAVHSAADIAGGTAEPIQKYKLHIRKLQQNMQRHADKIKQTDKKEISVLDELERIDGRLAEQKEKIVQLQGQISAKEQQLALKEQDVTQAKKINDTARLHLQKRLRSFYIMGKTGFPNVAFSTKTLPELMLFDDSFRQLLNYDQSVIKQYRDTLGGLQRARDAKELEKTILLDLLNRSENEQQSLQAIRQEKRRMLTGIKTQKGLYEQALKEMKKARTDLTSTLTDLKQKEENRARGFLHNKGKLPAPVNGRVVTRFSPPRSQNSTEDGTARGITIKTADKARVKAVYAGKIIFADYMRGFGNMVIIDHGLQYFSITARLDQILKKEGELIKGGEIIAEASDIATLFAEGMYFEI
ncbi:MAG: peptidoglycan DD-metalloendopeptidase family protein, partial [Desulfobulbaceae bacterium]|nr:peptidoglycan DD-metalloendopeptidase family protein [Desulfobulbaceae bacterium]